MQFTDLILFLFEVEWAQYQVIWITMLKLFILYFIFIDDIS